MHQQLQTQNSEKPDGTPVFLSKQLSTTSQQNNTALRTPEQALQQFLTTPGEESFAQKLITTENFEDKDFNLSQSMISDALKKGDALFTDCKDVFLDLQKHKNQNNVEVKRMMREMQQLMDSNFIDQSSVNIPLNESSFNLKGIDENDKSAKNQQSNGIFSPSSVFGQNEIDDPKFVIKEDENNYHMEVDARLSDPTPKKAPQFDIEKIRF